MKFDERVWQLTKKIPKGKVTTYKMISATLKTKAYRAVGNALRNNKKPIIIPCHRVVKSNGKIGGFARGTKNKIKLLKEERVEIRNNKIDLRRYLFRF